MFPCDCSTAACWFVGEGLENFSLYFTVNWFLSLQRTTHKEPRPYLDPILLGDKIIDLEQNL